MTLKKFAVIMFGLLLALAAATSATAQGRVAVRDMGNPRRSALESGRFNWWFSEWGAPGWFF